MTFNAAGWLSWAVESPGIPDKIYTQINSVEWVTLHSMVGKTEGAVGRLMSEERQPDGRYTDYAAASVQFLLDQDSTLIQMYRLWDACWASGTRDANTRSVAVELEGGNYPNYSEPMTDGQVSTALRFLRDLAAFRGWDWATIRSRLREHNEFQQTACPSGRWQRLYDALENEEGLSVEDKERLARLEAIMAGNGLKVGDNFLTGEAALAHLDAQKVSAFGSISEMESPTGWVATGIRQARAEGEAANAKVSAHIANHGATLPLTTITISGPGLTVEEDTTAGTAGLGQPPED